MNIDWVKNFIYSDTMDELIAYRLAEAVRMNRDEYQKLIEEAETRTLEKFELEDMQDCIHWETTLIEAYRYFAGDAEAGKL